MVNPECLKGMEFVSKFYTDYVNLENLGFKKYEILKMLGTQQYYQDFVDTPEWLVSAKKLPKGYKWSDGTKFHDKATKKSTAETYHFLIVGSDLYIKNLLNRKYEKTHSEIEANDWEVPDVSVYCIPITDTRICVIKDWKSKKLNYVIYQLYACMTPFLERCIGKFWCDNGGVIHMLEHNPLLDKMAEKLLSEVCNE